MNDNLDKIGQITDELESIAAGLILPMPEQFHLEQLKVLLPEKIEAIRKAIIIETGENPWNI